VLASLDPPELPFDRNWVAAFRLKARDREATLLASKDDVRKTALKRDFILGR